MSESAQLLAAAKRCLRARGLTYRDVAKALDLSEASVKRLFSEESFSLKRLESLCALLDIHLFDLAKMTREDVDQATTLTLEQEKALAADPKLLAAFYLLCNGWSLKKAAHRIGVKHPHMIRLAIGLERLGLIDLQPGNRVRLRTARGIHWRQGGPVREKYAQQAMREFLDHEFAGGEEWLALETAELSEASIQVVRRKIDRLLREFRDLAETDVSLPHKDRQSVALMTAFRPWVFSLMDL